MTGLLCAISLTAISHAGPKIDTTELDRLSERSGQLFQAGEFAAAIPLSERIVDLSRLAFGESSARLASALCNLGAVYREAGDPAKAAEALSESLRIQQVILDPEHEATARTLYLLGLVHRDQQDLVQAESFLTKSLSIRQKVLPAHHSDVIRSLTGLGDVYGALGRTMEAERVLMQAIESVQATAGDDDVSLIPPLNSLGTIYVAVQRWQDALRTFERALAISRHRFNGDHPSQGVLYANIGSLYRVLDRYDEAEASLHRALAFSANPLQVANIRTHLALVQSSKGNLHGAVTTMSEVVAIRQKQIPGTPLLANSLENLAILKWAAGNPQSALEPFTNATQIREAQVPQVLALGSASEKESWIENEVSSLNSVLTWQMYAQPQSRVAAELAIRSLLFRKGLLLDTLSSESHLTTELAKGDRELAEMLRVLRERISALWFSHNDSGDAFVRFEVNRLLERQLASTLRSRNPELSVLTPVPTLTAVRAALSDNAVLLDWIRVKPVDPIKQGHYASRYFCYGISKDGHLAIADLGAADEIDAQVAEFRKAILANQDGDIDAIRKMGAALEQRILSPVYRLIENKTELILSPDSQLSMLPFAALVDAKGKYAGERWTLRYVSSGRDLVRSSLQVTPRSEDMVFANPAFGLPRSSSGRRFADLPGTSIEAEGIKKALPKARIWRGADATEARLKGIQAPRILHLATHGFFKTDGITHDLQQRGKAIPADGNYKYNIDPMLRSGIALAGANEGTSGSADGILSALEVLDLDLRGTQMVVLSACDTGLGDAITGEGIYGLRRAFAVAGAQTQLLTLWKINDYATAALMERFYGHLVTGARRDEALRVAQLTLRNSPGHSHPYYWAGFVMSGEGAPIHVQ